MERDLIVSTGRKWAEIDAVRLTGIGSRTLNEIVAYPKGQRLTARCQSDL